MCQMWYGAGGLGVRGSGCIEDETVSHEGDKHNTQVMPSLGDCLVFLVIQAGGHGVSLIGLGGMGLRGGCFGQSFVICPEVPQK